MAPRGIRCFAAALLTIIVPCAAGRCAIAAGPDPRDDELEFHDLGAAKAACPSRNTESEFLGALAGARRYQLFGRILELMDEDGKVLVRFEERAAR